MATWRRSQVPGEERIRNTGEVKAALKLRGHEIARVSDTALGILVLVAVRGVIAILLRHPIPNLAERALGPLGPFRDSLQHLSRPACHWIVPSVVAPAPSRARAPLGKAAFRAVES